MHLNVSWGVLKGFKEERREKQPPEVFYNESYSKKFCNIHRKTPVLESVFKKRLQRRYCPVKIAKFLWTIIFDQICKRLPLKPVNSPSKNEIKHTIGWSTEIGRILQKQEIHKVPNGNSAAEPVAPTMAARNTRKSPDS